MAVHNRVFLNTDPEFHLIKKKNKKGKPIYHVGFLSDQLGRNGKPSYKLMKSTGVGSRVAAEKIARQMIADGIVFKIVSKRVCNFTLEPSASGWLRNRSQDEFFLFIQ
ncbi:hypothetical protein [Spirochaeta africana]|uniref:Uncharacterized protein n=1 Tax=Spirochaeta africana (strain ATCC 700263 / DSM 8902 / Z-7692) TaxID=889378 RepID=H9UIR9_SPIAZ|nr:hypothetical protein [Spirochaeta africana]AFG37412.1 hypothetical protein Spiaf_1343 [Spirochaeta africana DSM 8902]